MRIPPTLFFLFIVPCMFGQAQSDTLYYTDARFWNYSKKKSDYMRIISVENGIKTEIQKNDKKGRLYLKKMYKGEEPVGVWEKLTKSGIEYRDYNFEVEYVKEECISLEEQNPIKLLMVDIPPLHYKRPRIIIKGDEKTITQAFRRFFNPPKSWRTKSLKGGLQIRVDALFTVTKEGNVEDIKIVKGQQIEIDKELVRTLKQMKFTEPAKRNGKAVEVCVRYPIRLHMRPNSF